MCHIRSTAGAALADGLASHSLDSGGWHLWLAHLISQKVFVDAFFKSQLPHKSVNLSFIITYEKNKLMDLCGH